MRTIARVAGAALLGVFSLLACGIDTDRPAAAIVTGESPPPVGGGSSTSGSSTTSSSSGSTSTSSSGTTDDGGASSSGGSSGTASSSGTSGDSGTTNAECMNVPREGTTVAELNVAAAPPAPSGGQVAAGTYYLTTWESYTGVGGVAGLSGETRKATLVVSASQMKLAATDLGDAQDFPIVSETYTVQGTTLTTDEQCPVAGRQVVRSYSATLTTLDLLLTFGATTRRLVYTKQ